MNSSRQSNPERILDPKVLASIADLGLVARIIVDGTVSGLHRSPFHGYSAEFSQYRHYRPGDDVKYVDWKLFARTDRVFTKQYRETTNLSAHLAIDGSGSMMFSGESALRKFDYARLLAAALGQLIAWQGDAVGVAVHGGDVLAHVPPRLGPSHFRRVLAALSTAHPTSGTGGAGLGRIVDLMRRRGVLLVFSDGYEEDVLEGEIKRALRMGHEVALFHVLCKEEIEFPYRGDMEFEDMETKRRVLANSRSIGPTYRAAIEAFIARWRSRADAARFVYTQARTDTPPDRVLRQYLLMRAAPAGRGA